MTTFTTVTYNVPAQSRIHPDRCPLSRPGALDPARRRVPLDRVAGPDADLLCAQELEPAVHDDLRARPDATHHTAPGEPPSLTGPSDHLPPRVDFT